ncbi:MAG: hypothetical protein ACI9PZ_002373, partial [Parvicella sp.]
MSKLLERHYSIREKRMNMKKRLLPLAVSMLLSTTAVAKDYLGAYFALNSTLTPPSNPSQTVGQVTFSEGASGSSAEITVEAEHAYPTVYPYSSVREPGPSNVTVGGESVHPAMMFAGQSNNTLKTLRPAALLVPMSMVGNPSSDFYSPTSEDIGAGLDPNSNYAFQHYVSVEELLNLNSPTDATYPMGQVTYTFSTPVDNPILHVTGLGGFFASADTGLSMLFSVDLELVPDPTSISLTRLSGSDFTALVGDRITNIYSYDDFSNNLPAGANGASGETAGSGSFRVNGSGITSVTFNVSMVGKMTASDGSAVPAHWSSLQANTHNFDGSAPDSTTESSQKYTGDRFNTTWTLPLDKDFGDAIDDGSVIDGVARNYSTADANGGAYHRVVSGLFLGSSVDAEADATPNSPANGDDVVGDDEDGVSFSTTGDGSSTLQLTAAVTGTNTLGEEAMLCGWLDGAADGVVTGTFNRNVTYVTGGVGTDNPTAVGAGNEELCIRVLVGATTTSVELAGSSNPAEADCTGGVNFSCTLTWHPHFTTNAQAFARFRLTTAAQFFNNNSPSPIGYAADGEVEDYSLNFTPTAVTMGSVDLKAMPVDEFLGSLGAGRMDNKGLLELLRAWDPALANSLAWASRDEVLSALASYLDPDGDGQVA